MNISKNNKQLASVRYYVIIPHTPRFDLQYRTYFSETVWNRKGLAEIPHFDKMGGNKINGRVEIDQTLTKWEWEK